MVSFQQNVLKLKVAVKKASLVKLSDEKADGSNRFPLRGKVFTGGMRSDFAKILHQIHSPGDFQGEKISLVEWKEDAMVDGADGGDRRNSTGSDFFCQGEFPERSRPEEIEISCDGSQQPAV